MARTAEEYLTDQLARRIAHLPDARRAEYEGMDVVEASEQLDQSRDRYTQEQIDMATSQRWDDEKWGKYFRG